MGQPTKLTDEVSKRIVSAVKKGCPIDVAARAGGIAPATLYNWKVRARSGESPYVEFLEQLKTADAQAEKAAIELVRKASLKTWQAAAWWLERRKHKRWARRDMIQQRHEVGKPSDVSDAEYERLLREEMARLEAKKSA